MALLEFLEDLWKQPWLRTAGGSWIVRVRWGYGGVASPLLQDFIHAARPACTIAAETAYLQANGISECNSTLAGHAVGKKRLQNGRAQNGGRKGMRLCDLRGIVR